MATSVSVTHAFVSTKSDGTDPAKVKPSDWNAAHTITVPTGTMLGRQTAGTGAAEALTASEARAVLEVDQAGTFSGTNTQTGTAYTLVASDRGKIIQMSNTAANTLTIPSNAAVAFPIGTIIGVLQDGTGQTSIDISTDTLDSIGLKRNMRAQYSFAQLLKVSSTRWILTGDIAS